MARAFDDLNCAKWWHPNFDRFTWSNARQLLQDPTNRERRQDSLAHVVAGKRANRGATVGVRDTGKRHATTLTGRR